MSYYQETMFRAFDWVHRTIGTLSNTAESLVWPAVVFLFLGLMVRRAALVDDARETFHQTVLNLKIIVFNVLLIVPLLAFVATFIHDTAGNLAVVPKHTWSVLPGPVVSLLAIFIGDFVGYWRHRLEHSRLLWPSHAVHHSDTQMGWLTLERFHPINRLTTLVIDTTALLILGLPPWALFANNLVRHYYGYLIHANLPWTYGKLGLVFVSPAMHRWHHAADPRYHNTNFASVFSVFDRLFGTFRVPGPCTSKLGVEGVPARFRDQMLYSLKPSSYGIPAALRSGSDTELTEGLSSAGTERRGT